MGLSAKEKRLLENLQRKAEEPDAPPSNKVLNISIDLGDDKQVERARGLGLLGSIMDDGDDGTGDDDGGKDDEAPRRRGFFAE